MMFALNAAMRLVVLLLIISSATVGCGPVKRSILWRNDPIPFLMVMHEGGECIPILDGKLSRVIHVTKKNMPGISSDIFDCRGSAQIRSGSKDELEVAFRDWHYSIVFHFQSEQFKNQSESMRVPEILTVSALDIATKHQLDITIIGYINLFGPDTARGLFCTVVLIPVELTLVLNVGQDNKMHVMSGMVNRYCTGIG